MPESRDIHQFRDQLNQVSPSFCIAKWKQVTIHLHSGQTHSCHHPGTHKIPLKEIRQNPSALHNTRFKKKQRELMLKGERPAECSYCWNIEDLKTDNVSDRTYKSASYWAKPYMEECRTKDPSSNTQPSYVELNFSNVCNLKCSYCSPHCSSQWYEEIRKHGYYPTSRKFNSLSYFDQLINKPLKEENNPYIEAWNKWWPELKDHLKVLRITGGEPLLSKQSFKTMDDLIKNPNKDLEFAINSNLCVPYKVINKFLERAKPLSEGSVKQFDLFASIDTWGKQAEYIRFGFNLDRFTMNVRKVLNHAPKTRITFMCTYNALSPFKFRYLLEYVLKLRRDYPESYILLDISYLRYPPHQSVKILGGKANEIIRKDVEFMKSRPRNYGEQADGFYPAEIEKLERIYQYAVSESQSKNLKKDQDDFFSFFLEHDKRRKTDLFKTFPQLKDFHTVESFKRDMMDAKADDEVRKSNWQEILKISPTMCTAKWLQSTIHLQNGLTHSCHHPVPHKIPLDELKNNPKALHNTQHKLRQRELMLKGERPSECEYCWKIEDLKPQFYSDRTYKSVHTGWSLPYLQRVKEAGGEKNIDPSYLEVSFSHACNFKCVYCSPEVSSKWMEEIRQHGPIELSQNKMHDINYLKESDRLPYDVDKENPYVEAFWKWWPELYPSLNTFRITGGEPLLNKDTWKVLEFIEKNPRKDFSLAVNSNLGVSQPIIDKLIDYSNRISERIGNFEIYTSLESVGRQAEYIRHGLNYEQFLQNAHNYLTNTPCKLHFMVTSNLLSLPGFKDFLKQILELRHQYNYRGKLNRIPMMVSYLRWPTFLDVRLATDELKKKYTNEILELVKTHSYNNRTGLETGYFYLEEIDQIHRLLEYMNTDMPNSKDNENDFQKYIQQINQRRKLNFYETFPEFENHFNK